jgi:ABC-type nitrate/sulfonate/bicarbonate transport system substrate-binding protein
MKPKSVPASTDSSMDGAPVFDRRRFLGFGARAAGGLALAGAAGPLLAACGSSKPNASTTATTAAAAAASATPTTAGAAKSVGKVAYQFSWIENFQFAGEYLADTRGYFTNNGVDIQLLPGGPSTTVDPIVISGKALVGNGSPDTAASDNAKGASLKVIGAQYQKSPFCIISRVANPIKTPQDMAGKKIGIQAANETLWTAFLTLSKVNPSTFTKVPVQFDVSALSSGSVDGFFGYSNDDVLHLKSLGHDVTYFLLADYGYKLFTSTYVVNSSTLSDATKRAALVAFMKGDIKGWQDAVADPAAGAQLTVTKYGKSLGLDAKEQEESCQATNALMVNADTNQHGLFWMTDAAIADTIATLKASGITATPSMFTNEILQEVYQGGTHV